MTANAIKQVTGYTMDQIGVVTRSDSVTMASAINFGVIKNGAAPSLSEWLKDVHSDHI